MEGEKTTATVAQGEVFQQLCREIGGFLGLSKEWIRLCEPRSQEPTGTGDDRCRFLAEAVLPWLGERIARLCSPARLEDQALGYVLIYDRDGNYVGMFKAREAARKITAITRARAINILHDYPPLIAAARQLLERLPK